MSGTLNNSEKNLKNQKKICLSNFTDKYRITVPFFLGNYPLEIRLNDSLVGLIVSDP